MDCRLVENGENPFLVDGPKLPIALLGNAYNMGDLVVKNQRKRKNSGIVSMVVPDPERFKTSKYSNMYSF